MTDISVDDWRAELERVLQEPRYAEGLTTWELVAALNITPNRANALLRRAFREGRLVAGRKPGFRRDGVPCMLPCYLIRPGGSDGGEETPRESHTPD